MLNSPLTTGIQTLLLRSKHFCDAFNLIKIDFNRTYTMDARGVSTSSINTIFSGTALSPKLWEISYQIIGFICQYLSKLNTHNE